MNMSEMINGLVLSRTVKVSEDEDAKKAGLFKVVHLRIKVDNVTVGDVFEKAMATVAIQWQTKARKEFSKIINGGTVDINFNAPARTQVDNKAVTKSWMQDPNVPQAEKDAYIAELIAAKSTT